MSDHDCRLPMSETQRNFFSLFGFDQEYDISMDTLEKAYISLQRSTHPDRFAGDSGGQAIAIRYASFVNEAYETLKSPLKRAQYLLSLKGMETDLEHSIVDDHAFLMEQMELRETLSDIDQQPQSEKKLKEMINDISKRIDQLEEMFEASWRHHKDLQFCVGIVQKMHFMHKLLQEAKKKEELLSGA